MAPPTSQPLLSCRRQATGHQTIDLIGRQNFDLSLRKSVEFCDVIRLVDKMETDWIRRKRQRVI